MRDKKVWLITGAGRGMGVDIARAALAAGDAVVATARKAGSVTAALGEHDDLLAVKLDVTDPADAEAAVKAAVERFGRLDVLVNNAGNFNAGFFEEISPQDFRAQIETTLFGPVNVTRAALPVMRAQRSGLLVTISSTAGIAGQEFCTAYAASKFGVEGWIESPTPDVRAVRHSDDARRVWLLPHRAAHAGVDVVRRLLDRRTTPSAQSRPSPAGRSMNGRQSGDPAKLAGALVQLASQDEPPLRFPAGADVSAAVEQKAGTCWPRPAPTANRPAASPTTMPEPPPTRSEQACRRLHRRRYRCE